MHISAIASLPQKLQHCSSAYILMLGVDQELKALPCSDIEHRLDIESAGSIEDSKGETQSNLNAQFMIEPVHVTLRPWADREIGLQDCVEVLFFGRHLGYNLVYLRDDGSKEGCCAQKQENAVYLQRIITQTIYLRSSESIILSDLCIQSLTRSPWDVAAISPASMPVSA